MKEPAMRSPLKKLRFLAQQSELATALPLLLKAR
jgi:hypothetical protein